MKEIELSHVLETLMYHVYDDSTPCEAGLYCPFYDDHNPCAYCTNGNCVEGMTKFVMELCEKQNTSPLYRDEVSPPGRRVRLY